MARTKNHTLIAAARADYISGTSMRDLAAKLGLHWRTIQNWAKAGHWEQERQLSQNVAQLPALLEATERRAVKVDSDWRTRLESIIATQVSSSQRVAELSERILHDANSSQISQMDVRDLVTIGKILADTSAALVKIMPGGSGDGRLPMPREIDDSMSLEDQIREFIRDVRGGRED